MEKTKEAARATSDQGEPDGNGGQPGRGRGGGSPLEKVTVNLTRRSVEALDRIVGSTGESKTDAINRALQIYGFIQEQLDGGASLYIKDEGSDRADRLKIL